MKIGIIGTGTVGTTLGELWIQKHHDVMFGSRDPSSAIKKFSDSLKSAKVGTYSEATQFADVLVLAVHWDHVKEALTKMGKLKNKILIDCINPIAPNLAGLKVGLTTSAAEEIAKLTKDAKVVKAFNTTGAQNFKNPNFGEQKASGFICGDDKDAKKIVSELVQDVGFEVVDVGPLSYARLLEPLAMLWISLAFAQGYGPNIAFKLLKR